VIVSKPAWICGIQWLGVLSKPIRRTDPVSDAVKELIGVREKSASCDEQLATIAAIYWQVN